MLVEAGELHGAAGEARSKGPTVQSTPPAAAADASLKSLIRVLLRRSSSGEEAAGEARLELAAGAILEAMREAIIHDRLDELPDRVAALQLMLGEASGEKSKQHPSSAPRPRTRERRWPNAARSRQTTTA